MKYKLHKSTTDKKLAGVCGGIAESFEIDSTIVRVVWVLTSLFYGVGLILYIACALIFPEGIQENKTETPTVQVPDTQEDTTEQEIID